MDGVPVYDENGIAVYEDVPKTYGLTAGESYTIGVSAWRLTDDGIIVYSEEKKSEPFTVSEPVKTTFVWTGNNARLITETRTHDTKVVAFETEAYNTNDVTARLTASAPVSGSWTLDGGAETAVSATDTICLLYTS